MIEFSREKGVIHIKVTGQHPVANLTWYFKYDSGGEAYAALLTENFKQHLWDVIKEIRRDSYERGWKDAKSHRAAKQDYFSGAL